ncbi:MAG: hypothetical protein JWO80_2413 [Bryobacterales bacterium]|nr:hypothetical protein [Bryobacterales bacterium]
MSLNLVKDIRSAYAHLNPNDVRRLTERPLSVGLVANDESGYAAMERFLAPVPEDAELSVNGFAVLNRISANSTPGSYDLILCEEGVVCARNGYIFHPDDPARTICEILDGLQELEIPLARHFLSFREPVVNRIIHRISRENALFALVTALPNVVPNLLELPWAVGEFATDTAFLTINQVRLAFLIAAANGKTVGYGEQKAELASIVAAAFGWRAIARELIGKIPLGGGLIPKAAVAFAGTYVVGLSLERLHRTGSDLRRSERRAAYEQALERGKGIVRQLLPSLKKRNAA